MPGLSNMMEDTTKDAESNHKPPDITSFTQKPSHEKFLEARISDLPYFNKFDPFEADDDLLKLPAFDSFKTKS